MLGDCAASFPQMWHISVQWLCNGNLSRELVRTGFLPPFLFTGALGGDEVSLLASPSASTSTIESTDDGEASLDPTSCFGMTADSPSSGISEIATQGSKLHLADA